MICRQESIRLSSRAASTKRWCVPILTAAETVRALYDINIVTLSGGVFMNRYLTERALSDLQAAGFTIALNRELPPNDASVSYGQAVIGLHSNEGGQ